VARQHLRHRRLALRRALIPDRLDPRLLALILKVAAAKNGHHIENRFHRLAPRHA